jgi:hypothetical protein
MKLVLRNSEFGTCSIEMPGIEQNANIRPNVVWNINYRPFYWQEEYSIPVCAPDSVSLSQICMNEHAFLQKKKQQPEI